MSEVRCLTFTPVRTIRSIGESALAIIVVLFALLGWSGRFVSPARASQPSARPGQSGPILQQVPVAEAKAAEVKGAIEAYLINGLDPAFGALTPLPLRELEDLYRRRDHLPLWIDASGQPSLDAGDALTILRGAADDGLEPADYAVGQLDPLMSKLRAPPPSIADLASFDVALSASILRYLQHLHAGRVDPRTIGLRLTVPADQHDFAALVQSAAAEHRMSEAVAELRPQLAQYRALRTMLAQYRSIARDVDSPPMALPAFASVVHPGEGTRGSTHSSGDSWRSAICRRARWRRQDRPYTAARSWRASNGFSVATDWHRTGSSAEARTPRCSSRSRRVSVRSSSRSSAFAGCRTWANSASSRSTSRCSACGPGTRFRRTATRCSAWTSSSAALFVLRHRCSLNSCRK